jgi:hypothetical protein
MTFLNFDLLGIVLSHNNSTTLPNINTVQEIFFLENLCGVAVVLWNQIFLQSLKMSKIIIQLNMYWL